MSSLNLKVPEKLVPLLGPNRYKGAYGGRGGAKSHFFAEMLIARCYSEPTRAVCIREIQKSLKQSVHQLLCDKIQANGLGHFFTPYEAEIRGANGSLIIFQGMQNHTAETIKSLEGYQIAWVEEAQTLSEKSLRMLRPTIRSWNSELWFSWNPRYDTDPVDKLFRGARPPRRAVSVLIGWQDNPWFPDELREEMEDDYLADPLTAENVWGGGYEIVTAGSYYGKELARADAEGRIGEYPHDPSIKVRTGWDIGVDDYTAIWYFQEHRRDGKPRIRVIDYYETSGDGADLIAGEAIHAKPYQYDMHFFPHDVEVREWGAGARSRRETLLNLGVQPIRRGARQGPEERINATRALLPICEFDNNERVQLGLKRLRRYTRKLNEQMQVYQGPLHDENSHGADAFGEYAINCGVRPAPEVKKKAPMSDYKSPSRYEADTSWL